MPVEYDGDGWPLVGLWDEGQKPLGIRGNSISAVSGRNGARNIEYLYLETNLLNGRTFSSLRLALWRRQMRECSPESLAFASVITA